MFLKSRRLMPKHKFDYRKLFITNFEFLLIIKQALFNNLSLNNVKRNGYIFVSIKKLSSEPINLYTNLIGS